MFKRTFQLNVEVIGKNILLYNPECVVLLNNVWWRSFRYCIGKILRLKQKMNVYEELEVYEVFVDLVLKKQCFDESLFDQM